MAMRSKGWFVAASLFTAINVGGGIFAFAGGSLMHGVAHVLLTLVGAVWMLRVSSESAERDALLAPELDRRMESLQQSLDSIAVDVERLGEAQRYVAKVAAEKAAQLPPK
jgi:hypothetical protein